jgi:hypothetical protein
MYVIFQSPEVTTYPAWFSTQNLNNFRAQCGYIFQMILTVNV